MIYNLLFLGLIALSHSSFLSKRCFPLVNPGTPQPPVPINPPTPQPPAPQPPAPAPQPPAPAPQPPAPAPSRIETGNPAQPLKNGACFYMVNVQNGQAVTFKDNSMEIALSGARSNNEVICVENAPNNAYFIHWKRDWNRVFDIFGGGSTDGTRLIKYPKHGGVNQQFRFQRNAQGQYLFVAVNSNKAFGLWSGVPIAQSTPNSNNRAQLWNLVPA